MDKVDELQKNQAIIRDHQRWRMDEIHASCHDFLRNKYRISIGTEVSSREQDELLEKMHKLCHEFMWDFDRAVMIHERIAILQDKSPENLTKALWPVRTAKPEEGKVIKHIEIQKN